MQEAQAQLQARTGRASRAATLSGGGVTDLSPEALVQQLQERHAALKAAASTPSERATIELVALMFQSILTEERLPAGIRVWFARLQMPTLRVALAEPEFFSSEQHPARRLIDRMGGCVMGFEGTHSERIGPALEAEIKRVVQVIEAFPDTGRRVFQTVLTEFEQFLETYFRDRSDNTRRGVSLAQQIEQRQALAVQYTIELRKMLEGVPVPDAVRQFLFQMWADVLATVAVRNGNHSDAIHAIRDAASELVWAVSAKTQADERLDMVRRTPVLMTMLRQGMHGAGVVAQRQQDALTTLHEPLAAAFSAQATTIDPSTLGQLQLRLATLEDMLPEDGLALDESWVMDEALYEYEGVEVVAEGGSMPTPETLARVERLQTGESFLLERGAGHHESLRLIWHGAQRQLWLFVAPQGCLLFQKARLAAYMQAGLMLAAQDDTLMTKATRAALRQIKQDPARLLAA